MSRDTWPASETAVARPIVAYLKELQWEVYQEVKLRHGDNRADVVAVQGPVVWIVEVKVNASMAVIQQAYDWLQWGHFVSIGVPYRRNHPRVYHKALEHFGIGEITVRPQFFGFKPDHERGAGDFEITEWRGRFNRKSMAKQILSRLSEEHKTYSEAGSATGKFWSPFRATCTRVAEFVVKNPGIRMSEMLKKIDTHYANRQSAQGSLARWIKAGKVEGVELRKEGKRWNLYPVKKET